MTVYRSFLEQAARYFVRPHESVPSAPIASPAAWLGRDVRARGAEWIVPLAPEEVREVAGAVAETEKEGLAMEAITADRFPLPRLGPRIAGWRREIAHGRGFVVLRGLPVEAWGPQRSAPAFWGLGHHLGVPGAQNPQGDLLGHVTDTGDAGSAREVRLYRTTSSIDFHCDAADVVGLLCLQTALRGGQSRIASSVAIFNELARERADLVRRLFEPFWLDRRGEERPGEAGFVAIPPCRHAGGVLRTFYHSEYFRSVVRHPEVGALDPQARELLDAYDAIAARPDVHLDMSLERGDMQFISNHTTIHARTGYEDSPDPARKRHLLRLWLSHV